jgi:probable HAF family extracellular repeat protein
VLRPRSISRRRLLLASLGASGYALRLGRFAPVAAAARFQGQAGYAISSLGDSGRASAINAKGQIAGLSGSTAAMWDRGALIDLGTWPGDTSSEALAINAGGVVVGVSWSAGSQPHGVAWAQGQAVDLGTLPGGTESTAYAINANNQIVGWSDASDGAHHAVRWDLAKGRIDDLGIGANIGGVYAEATGINDAGDIVGWAETNDGERHAATIGQSGSFGDLGGQSIALAINASNQVVGVVRADDGNDHAALWDAGTLKVFGSSGTPCQATAISDQGIVVGSVANNGVDTAVYWDATTFEEFPLDSLQNAATIAYGVDPSGQVIVGESGSQPVRWDKS